AGVSETSTGELHAFLWEDGEMSDLGGGPFPTEVGINDRGQVVGHDTDAVSGGANASYWLWDGGTKVTIFTTYQAVASGPHIMIDDRGRIAFNTNDLAGTRYSYLWSGGEITPLMPPPPPLAAGTVSGVRASATAVGVTGSSDGP